MNPKKIILHHTGGTDAYPLQDSSNYTLAQCNADHKARFNMKSSMGYYVGYHYYIDKKGIVTQTRVDTEEGAHCVGYNNAPGSSASSRSVGICLAGNFDSTLPTPDQITSLKSLLKRLNGKYGINPADVFPHRSFAQKTCYGNRLNSQWGANLMAEAIAGVDPAIKACRIGDSGKNITAIQSILTKGNYNIVPMQSGFYDANMSKCVLYFQLKRNVSSLEELSNLRGEVIGPKTLSFLK